ncbi:putative Ig domain-containing protein [Spirosoma sp. KUDC1026]|uniref:putative Ig domain-containing protein n=1 Tax=Spirosoma sp. KUDC1026 TaxID=2745947 RepID=UPI00159BDBFE|nr:putative Ig domain-containing protein [Spirosoma sp. KUDC1026]QKZ14738.1 putative Ig domain-containing protein [Spirosoma sp. KUDC1026]
MNSTFYRFLFGLFLLMGSLAQAQTIRYVKQGATGSGSSWADASGDLQSQINFSGAQQVWVAAGIYKPTTGTDRTSSFQMKNGVTIYGGFVGSETQLSQRPAINPTTGQPSSSTLSGNIGSVGTNTDNSIHVVNSQGTNNTAVLDGFVIRDGYADGQSDNGAGAGMYNVLTSPTVRNCTFLNNTALYIGGAMYNYQSNISLTNCSFLNNTTSGDGGAINSLGGSPTLTNCSFLNNTASNYGGGIYNADDNPILTNCSFQNNSGYNAGGGMFISYSNLKLINSSFQANTSAGPGAGICSDNGTASLVNCIFQANSTSNGNSFGGGFYSEGGSASMTNCSFQANSVTQSGGAVAISRNGSASLTNCVLFGNGGGETFYTYQSTISATYCLIEASVTGYTDGGNNLTTATSPFASTSSAQLGPCSPAINAGSNQAYATANGPATDLAGNPRVFGDTIDMGAYEYQGEPIRITLSNPTTTVATQGVAFSQTFTVTGGSSPYSFSVVEGSLPGGLSLDGGTGALSGTPTQAGSYSVIVRATDANGCAATGAVYSLLVTDATPAIAGLSASPAAVCIGSPVTFTATLGNVTGSYAYTLTNGSGTSVEGTSTGSTFSQDLTVAGSGTQSFTLTINSSGQTTTAITSLTITSSPDYQPLVDLYNATNGANWTRKSGWLNGCDPCTGNGGEPWQGVSCTNGRVSQLDLYGNNLIGSLPASLSALTQLTFVQIDANQLNGNVPSGLGNLTQLTHLGLSYNQLSGTIPSSLANLTQLTYLDLTANQLSSNIPTSLSALTQLTSLSFYGNQLNGPIPSGLGNLTNLTNLILGNNQLSGPIPDSFGGLTKLVNLDLGGNSLNGSIPASLSALSQLTTLNLGVNPLSGSIPSSLSALSQLTSLYLDDSQLSGPIDVLGTLTSLRTANLSVNGFSGPVPASLANLPQLQTLNLYNNRLSGCFPASLTALCGKDILFGNNPGLPGGGDFATFCLTPTASASTTTPVVSVGQTVSLSATGGAYYSWSGPASFTANVANPSFVASSPAQSGTYSVTVSNGSCENNPVSSVDVTVNALSPTIASLSASPNPVCAGSPVTFTATVGNVTGSYAYTLTNGSGTSIEETSTGSAFSQDLTAAGSGAQSFTLTVNSSGQTTTATTSLTVTTPPNAAITYAGSPFLTSSSPVSVSQTGTPGGSYSSRPAGLSLNPTTGQITPASSSPGTYTVTYTVEGSGGCAALSTPASVEIQASTPIRYVKQGGTGSGSSWSDASGDLQRQINLAGTQQVWVAAGIYKPTTGTDRNVSFSLKNGVAVYGGFAGTETALSQRVAVNPVTGSPSSSTLSGEIGVIGNRDDNSYHVIINRSLNSTAVLDGFLISEGNANGITGIANTGGGMYNNNSSPTLTNCSFQTNSGEVGGMFNISNSSPTLTNCSFQANSGGGMYNINSSSPKLINCSFQANSGEGMYNFNSSSPSLTNCSFQGNRTSSSGGGMVNIGSSPSLTNCSFVGNFASSQGGGMANFINSNPSLTNCVLFGNGGDNTIYNDGSASPLLRYSLIEASETDYTDGGNNLTTTINPFASTSSAQLGPCSPAINAGDNQAYTTANGPATDLAGNTRVFGGTIDMGAYEYQGEPTRITLSNPTTTVAAQGVAFSQSFTVVGGSAPYSFSVVGGSLPGGLSLDGGTGTLSGTPTQAGSYSITVRATDANGCAATGAVYSLVVTDATPAIAGLSASPNPVCAGSPVTFTATVGNLTGSYAYTLTNGSGTSVEGTSTGSTFSQDLTATGSGVQNFTLIVTANGQSIRSATSLTITSLPVAGLVSNGPLSCTLTSVTLTATGGEAYTFVNSSGTLLTGSGNTRLVSTPGTYAVTVANASGCTSTTSVTVTGDTAPPSVSLTNNGTISCANTSVVLTATPGLGSYTFSAGADQQGGSLGNTATVSAGGTYSVVVTTADGCSATASTTVDRTTNLPTPSLLTAQGQPAVTVTVNSGPVTLLASGCAGTINWTGPNNTAGTGTTINVPTSQPGTFVYRATCQVGTCVSEPATATVTVTAAVVDGRLTVLHRDVDNYADNNAVQPMLQLVNEGSAPLPLSAITLRYYLTVEGTAPLSNLSIFFAQVGDRNVSLRYVPLNPARSGASGYVEYSFSPDAGSLAAGANSGNIQSYFAKVDYSPLNELDDYSYATVRDQLVANPRITAYYNGALVWGTEPSGEVGCPTISLSASNNGMLSCGQPSLILTASGGQSYVFSSGTTPVSANQVSVSSAGLYSVTATSANGCVDVASVRVTASTTLPTPDFATRGNGAIADGLSSVTVVQNSAPVRFSATNCSGTLSWSGNELSGTGVLEAATASPGVLVYQATCRVGSCVSSPASVTLTVVGAPTNQPPLAVANANQVATVGVPFSYTVNAFTDEEPARLDYSATLSPVNGLTFNPATRVISGTPSVSGLVGVTITARDAGNLSASTSFSITVSPAPATTTALRVLHRDVDNYADNNAVQPLLQLVNEGSAPLPLSSITLRYYLTVEGATP